MSRQASILTRGETFLWKNDTGGTVNIGAVVKIGSLHAVVVGSPTEDATTTIASNGFAQVQICGLVYIPKKSGDTFAAGASVYWDATNSYGTSTVASGTRIGAAVLDPRDTAMPGSTALYQCILLNQPPAGIDSDRVLDSASGDNAGGLPVLLSLIGVTATAGTYAIGTAKRKLRIIDWFIISRDTTASNVKLANGVTDATANIAKGTADVTRVQGAAVIAAQRDVAAGTALNVITSGNATLDVFVWALPVA